MTVIGLNTRPARMQGMKPGRWIRRQRPDLTDGPIKDWAESIKAGVIVRLTRRADYWQGAVANCRSCQSAGNRPAVHWEAVTSASQSAALAVLMEGGCPIARCIVDPVRRVYQPIYGCRHYWLEARLIAAGFSAGEAVDGEALRRELGRIFGRLGQCCPPRARIVARKGREYSWGALSSMREDIARLEQGAAQEYAYAAAARQDPHLSDGLAAYRQEAGDRLMAQAEEAKDRYRRELRKWRSVCRRLGMDGAELGVTTITIGAEKLPQYVAVKRGGTIINDTGFYHDPEKQFLPAVWRGPTIWIPEAA